MGSARRRAVAGHRRFAIPPLPGLVAVSSAKVVPPGVELLSRSAAGDALGEAFPGSAVSPARR